MGGIDVTEPVRQIFIDVSAPHFWDFGYRGARSRGDEGVAARARG